MIMIHRNEPVKIIIMKIIFKSELIDVFHLFQPAAKKEESYWSYFGAFSWPFLIDYIWGLLLFKHSWNKTQKTGVRFSKAKTKTKIVQWPGTSVNMKNLTKTFKIIQISTFFPNLVTRQTGRSKFILSFNVLLYGYCSSKSQGWMELDKSNWIELVIEMWSTITFNLLHRLLLDRLLRIFDFFD